MGACRSICYETSETPPKESQPSEEKASAHLEIVPTTSNVPASPPLPHISRLTPVAQPLPEVVSKGDDEEPIPLPPVAVDLPPMMAHAQHTSHQHTARHASHAHPVHSHSTHPVHLTEPRPHPTEPQFSLTSTSTSAGGVTCWFALKAPHGTKMRFIDKGTMKDSPSWVEGGNINDWLKSLYANRNFTNWIVYNDEVVDHKVSDAYGHCKGIVAWNDKTVTWLVHSVPKFPASFDGSQIADIADGECVYGQSFAFIDNIALSKLDDIKIQLRIMHAYVYDFTVNIDHIRVDHHIREISLCPTGTVVHVAKAKVWGQDIYEHIADRYGGKWSCETWVRGKACEVTEQIKDAHQISWGSLTYKRTQDHSKYACSDEHVYVGDINRMTSQFHRGGGGVILQDTNISKLFAEIMQFQS